LTMMVLGENSKRTITETQRFLRMFEVLVRNSRCSEERMKIGKNREIICHIDNYVAYISDDKIEPMSSAVHVYSFRHKPSQQNMNACMTTRHDRSTTNRQKGFLVSGLVKKGG